MREAHRFWQRVGSYIPLIVISIYGLATGLTVAIWLPIAMLQGVWSVLETCFVQKYRGAPVRVIGESVILPLCSGIGAFVTVCGCLLEATLAARGDPDFMLAAGIAFGAVGVSLRLIAIRSLGPFFLDEIALLPGHQIETSGIYRFLKHPAEIGFLLAVLSSVLIAQSIVGASIFLIWLLPLSISRIRLENRMITERYLLVS